MVKERNSNIEMLRIISILFVVISHYSIYNGIDNSLLSIGINRYFLEISSLVNIGVILFIFITGYFMSDNKKGIRIGKLLTLYLQVLFYSIGAYFKKYSDNIFSRNKKFNYVVLIGAITMLLSSVIAIDILQVKFNFNMINSTYFFNRNSFVAIFF